MKLKSIVEQINKLISSCSSFKLPLNRLEFYIDSSVDTINGVLKTTYRTPRELFEGCIVYYNFIFQSDYDGIIDFVPEPNKSYSKLNNKYYYCIANDGYYIYQSDKFVEINPDNITITYTTLDSVCDKFNYDELPDNYIRQIIVYLSAALYLEEEDETEGQYDVYKNRALSELNKWYYLDYSCFDTGSSYEPLLEKSNNDDSCNYYFNDINNRW